MIITTRKAFVIIFPSHLVKRPRLMNAITLHSNYIQISGAMTFFTPFGFKIMMYFAGQTKFITANTHLDASKVVKLIVFLKEIFHDLKNVLPLFRV
jgi:hypothetical protein